jgi:hypothetical protein
VKARSRKNYRLELAPARLIGRPGALVVNMLNGDGTLERRFDFSPYSARPVMAAEIALAFQHHYADKSPATRTGAFQYLRAWFSFLDARSPTIVAMGDVDGDALRAYIVWLDRKPWTKGTRYTTWSALKQLLTWLKRHCPDRIQSDIEIPFNAFPRKNASTQPREALSRIEMEAVLAAARKDIEQSWSTFETGQTLLSKVDRMAVARERNLRRLDLDDLGVMLAVIVEHYGGIVPPNRVTLKKGTGMWRLHFASLEHGGNQKLGGYLHALPETMVPYMIAIGNKVMRTRRDCASCGVTV